MTTNVLMCVECDRRERWSRGLCSSCYSTAHRAGVLDEYPTQKFLDNPEAYIRWALGYYPELVGDIAIEFGKRVV